MGMSSELWKKNRILAGLPPSEGDLLLPHLSVQELHLGDTIEEAGKPIRFLHFAITAAISITNLETENRMVEVTVTGNEGCAGASIVLGSDRSPCMALVQIGGVALRTPARAVCDEVVRLPYLSAALMRYDLLVMRHAVISVGCSQFHSPSQRTARWLLAHWHRTGIRDFPFSDEFLAAQVGIRTKSVAEVLKDLEQQGVITKGRNRVTVVNTSEMEKRTCRCFFLAKDATEEYLSALTALAAKYSGTQNST